MNQRKTFLNRFFSLSGIFILFILGVETTIFPLSGGEQKTDKPNLFSQDFLDSRGILWRICPLSGTVLAFSPQINEPLWSGDGVVFSLRPLSPLERQNLLQKCKETSSFQEKPSSQIIPKITEIDGRIYILLNALDSDRIPLNQDSFDSEDLQDEHFSRKTLIALASDQEGRLLWRIDASRLPWTQAEFIDVPIFDPQRKETLLLQIHYASANELSHFSESTKKKLILRIDAATGEILSAD